MQEPPDYYVPLPSDGDIPPEELGEMAPPQVLENNNIDYIIGNHLKLKKIT